MVDATQVQIRRGTAAQIAGFVPVEGEVICNLTDDTLHVGDGSKPGGHPLPNVARMQSGQYLFATAGGTGNAVTVDLAPAVTALVTGMEFRFLATANNTGATTLNLNGLGAISLRKIVSGVPTNLTSGDISSGVIYSVVYDGVYFVLSSGVGSSDIAPAAGLTYDLYRHTPDHTYWYTTQETSYPAVNGFSYLNRSWVARVQRAGVVTVSFYHGVTSGPPGVSTRILINSTVVASWSNVVQLEVFRQHHLTVSPGDVITVQNMGVGTWGSYPARIRAIKFTSSTPAYGAISG